MLFCPFCGKEIKTDLPYPESKNAVKAHVKDKHPEKKVKF